MTAEPDALPLGGLSKSEKDELTLVCGGSCRRSARTRLSSRAVWQHLLAILRETPRR